MHLVAESLAALRNGDADFTSERGKGTDKSKNGSKHQDLEEKCILCTNEEDDVKCAQALQNVRNYSILYGIPYTVVSENDSPA